jgi:hypothetical protein
MEKSGRKRPTTESRNKDCIYQKIRINKKPLKMNRNKDPAVSKKAEIKKVSTALLRIRIKPVNLH